jgi:hypothetical protein
MNEENWRTLALASAEWDNSVTAFLVHMHLKATIGHASTELDRVHRLGDLLVALGRGLQDVTLR